MYSLRTEQIAAANDLLQTDWDGDGVISVHLPRDAGRQLLAKLGFTLPAEGRYGLDPIVAPTGEKFWETDEAIQVALVAATIEETNR